jgi:hypothetical protein
MEKQFIRAQVWLAGLMPVAFGQGDAPAVPVTELTYCDLMEKIMGIASWMYGLLMVLGVVFVLYAAFLYLISQGSEDRISSAKKVLVYAIVALVIAVLAGGVGSLIEDWGGVDTGAGIENCHF